MSISPKPSQEQPGTYAIQTVSGDEELNRLWFQDRMITTGMGGVLPEQSDPASFQRVLDIGCGPGSWLLETAKTYPTMSRLIGVDINPKMVNAARAQAKALQLDNRVEFHQMDALCHLEFPNEYFDLVNVRFVVSWLRTWDWPKFLQQCQRVTRPSGVVRVTESMLVGESTSPALTHLCQLTIEALHQSGHLFAPEGDGLTKELPRLLRQHGLQDVQTRSHPLEYRAGTPAGQFLLEDTKRLYRLVLPFLQKWTRVPDNYEEIYQQMLHELQQPDFVSTGLILTAWGTRSPNLSLPRAD